MYGVRELHRGDQPAPGGDPQPWARSRRAPSPSTARSSPATSMTITLACDHRILYGADAAQFLARVRALLEQPGGAAALGAVRAGRRRGATDERPTMSAPAAPTDCRAPPTAGATGATASPRRRWCLADGGGHLAGGREPFDGGRGGGPAGRGARGRDRGAAGRAGRRGARATSRGPVARARAAAGAGPAGGRSGAGGSARQRDAQRPRPAPGRGGSRPARACAISGAERAAEVVGPAVEGHDGADDEQEALLAMARDIARPEGSDECPRRPHRVPIGTRNERALAVRGWARRSASTST